jgi:hypothetical protein
LLPTLRKIEADWQNRGGAYRIEVAGAVEESSKGSSSIAAGVPVMLFITFTLLMLQLHSFSRAMLVFLTGPLGIAGVAAALLSFGRPFGFAHRSTGDGAGLWDNMHSFCRAVWCATPEDQTTDSSDLRESRDFAWKSCRCTR